MARDRRVLPHNLDAEASILGGIILRNDVLLRIATLDGVQPTALRELNEAMKRILAGASGNVKKAAMGGIRHAAEILSRITQQSRFSLRKHGRTLDKRRRPFFSLL